MHFIFSKIIFHTEIYSKNKRFLIVEFEPHEIIKIGDVLSDENGREYTVKSFGMIRFSGEIPKWYFKMVSVLLESEHSDIGEYLCLHQNTTLKAAYNKAKNCYKRLEGTSGVCDRAWEGKDWYLFSFVNFFIHPRDGHGKLVSYEINGKKGYVEITYGGCLGILVKKKHATVTMMGSGQVEMYNELIVNGRKMTKRELFSFRHGKGKKVAYDNICDR